MRRRVYFVLPTIGLTAAIIADLQAIGIKAGQLRVASREPEQISLPGVTVQDASTDRSDQLEHALWNADLVVFFIGALIALAILVTQGLSFSLLIPLFIMLLSFIAGLQFTQVPNTHLREFSEALRHGELVLMVSVPRDRVAEVEGLVQGHYPAATVGGVGWSSDLLHV